MLLSSEHMFVDHHNPYCSKENKMEVKIRLVDCLNNKTDGLKKDGDIVGIEEIDTLFLTLETFTRHLRAGHFGLNVQVTFDLIADGGIRDGCIIYYVVMKNVPDLAFLRGLKRFTD